jgi:CHAT domain-containing protein/tetratricopeptide (TPR) repeat protein
VWGAALGVERIGGSVDEARLHSWLGLAAWRLGEYDEARERTTHGLALARHLRDTGALAFAHNALGLVAQSEGSLSDAAQHFEDALAAFQQAGDSSGVARSSGNLGLVQYELGRFDEARIALRTARETARALQSPRIEGRLLTNLGLVEAWAGDPHAALELLREARVFADSADDAVGLENALGQTGVVYSILGQPGLALAMLDSAIAVARANDMPREEANDLVVIAGIYADAGDVEQALRAYEAARRINEELGLAMEQGTVLREEAVLRASRGALQPARRDAERALTLHRESGARGEEFFDLLALAEIERRAEQRGSATRILAQARPLAAELGSRQARVLLAIAEARMADDAGDPRQVVSGLADVESDARFAGAAAVAEVDALRLRAWSALGQLDSAVVAGRRAIEAIESIRDGFASAPLRTSFIADRSSVYADLVLALLQQGDTDGAFAAADAARGRAIMEHLAAARPGARRGAAMRDLAEAERLLRRIDQLVARLAREESSQPQQRAAMHGSIGDELMRSIERARSDYRTLLVQVAEQDPDRARLIGVRPANAAEIRTTLRPREAVMEFLPTAERLFVFVVRNDGVRVASSAVPAAELADRVRLARELLGAPGIPGREHAVSEALHRLLFAPALELGYLQDVEQLFVVPHGALAYLPFAALRDAGTDRAAVDDFVLTLLPSASVLPLLRGRVRASLDARAVAFAPFPERLPSTAQEAHAFRRAVPRATAVVGARASEAALRDALAHGRIVHVASHGIMNARNPLFSRIELARGRGGSADDGRLEVHELLDAAVASPLVFLSGCQTALGGAWGTSFDQGEDYATLAQAFLLAGAGAVVATLWRIEDEGAAAFAARFYQHLARLPPAGALAAAQRDLRVHPRWSDPYYWAAYTLSGTAPEPDPQTGSRASVQ